MYHWFFSAQFSFELEFNSLTHLLDQNPDGVTHKPLGDLQHVQGHGRAEQADLHRFREELEDIIDLVFESPAEHLVGFVKEELLDAVEPQGATVDHVKDTAGSSNNDVHASLEGADVVADSSSSNTGVHGDVHVVAEGDDHLLDLLGQLTGGSEDEGLALTQLGVQLGQGANGKGGGLSRTCLKLKSLKSLNKRNKEQQRLQDEGSEIEYRFQHTRRG